MKRRRTPLEQRFWRRVAIRFDSGCWEWQGQRFPHGYGRLARKEGGTEYVHRIAYLLTHSYLPEGFDIDHLCRNRACCNPAHLEAVRHRENMMRGDTLPARQVTRTHCPRGHEYSEANTYHHEGHRYCRACNNECRKRRTARGRASPVTAPA